MITCCSNRARLISFGIYPKSSFSTSTDRHNRIDQLRSNRAWLTCGARCLARSENIHRLLTYLHELIWNWEKTKWDVQQYSRSLSLLFYNMIRLPRNYLQLSLILNKYFALPFMDNTIWYRWMEKIIFSLLHSPQRGVRFRWLTHAACSDWCGICREMNCNPCVPVSQM